MYIFPQMAAAISITIQGVSMADPTVLVILQMAADRSGTL
jgi:hypothetical protein